MFSYSIGIFKTMLFELVYQINFKNCGPACYIIYKLERYGCFFVLNLHLCLLFLTDCGRDAEMYQSL